MNRRRTHVSFFGFIPMTTKSFILPIFFALPLLAADSTWVLKQSTLTYHVSHPLHQTDGLSHAARGKGICHQGQCQFLIAVPVETFESGAATPTCT